MFSLRTRQADGATVLELQGKVTIGEGDVALRKAISEHLDAGARQILLDLERVTSMDASGIGELVSADVAVKSRGGRLKLINVPFKVQDILQITQLASYFDWYESEPAAVASF
jgi:anti-sigma B factor antagonist